MLTANSKPASYLVTVILFTLVLFSFLMPGPQSLRILTQAGLASGLVFWLAAWTTVRPVFFRKFVGEATPGSLGVIRMLTCAILLTNTLWEDLGSSALLPREMINLRGIMKLLYFLPIGFDQFTANQGALNIFQMVTAVILFLALIGWKTRVMVPLGGLCYLLLGGILRHYAWYYHTGLIPTYLMLVLSFTPSGDGWSLDRLLKIFKGKPVPPADHPAAIYGWSRYACWVTLAVPYVAAGMSKLRNGGLFWWSADHMKMFLYRDTLAPMQFDWGLALKLNPAHNLPFILLGLSAVLGELTFGLVLFSRRARLIFPTTMAFMHFGILFLQNVFFFDLILLQLIFYDFTEIRKTVGHWLVSFRGSIEILYDGQCPFCRRTMRLLQGFDLFNRLRYIDFRGLKRADLDRFDSSLKPDDLEKEMVVISKGKVYRGFCGYRVLTTVLPIFWPIAPLLFLPGIFWAGEKIYGWVARNRLKLIRCDSSCATSDTTAPLLSHSTSPSFKAPLAISGFVALLFFCWYGRIEQYPLTGMQMYSRVSKNILTYYKVLARRESGDISRAPIEEAIGAMADSRYRRVLQMAFEPEKVFICEKFLYACGLAYNYKAPSGQKITEFEIQKWVWDFNAHPSDPNHGDIADRFVFSMNKGPL